MNTISLDDIGWWFYTRFYGPGVQYQFAENDANGSDVDVRVLLGATKDAPYNAALVYAQHFVPVPETDTAATKRHLIL